MILIVCIDDNGGMLFNKRRQSSDIKLIQRIMENVGKSKIWLNEYSAKLFADNGGNIGVASSFLEKAREKEYCFAENTDVSAAAKKAERIIVYRWNRRYPADLYFPLECLNMRTLVKSTDFIGNSHEKITEEIYE